MTRLLAVAAFAALTPVAALTAQTTATTTITTDVVTTPQGEYRPLATQEGHVVANVQPGPATTVPPVKQVPSWQAKPGAVPGPDGVIHQWGPQQPVSQSIPPAATEYPPCTKGRTDSCYNPNPNKEANVRADGKIGA